MRALTIASILLVLGCSEMSLQSMLTEEPRGLPPPPPPEPEVYRSAPGSLWQGDASRRFLAFENRAKRVGDLVTVMVEEAAEALNKASTELDRETKNDVKVDSDVALQGIITRPILGLLSLLGFTDQRHDKSTTADITVLDTESKSEFDGEGTVEREATFTTVVTCVVVDITASGLLQIEGERHLTINHEKQIIRIGGYVRPEDVELDNSVKSSMIANADIYYGGEGAISTQQKDPWLTRVFHRFLPF